MDYRKLDELNRLRREGALTEEEFQREKQKLFDEEETAVPHTDTGLKEALPMGLQENSYLALMNFLILAPYVGWMLPIILWIIGKNASEKVNKQGQYILNWYVTWFLAVILLGTGWLTSIPLSMFNENGFNFHWVWESTWLFLPLSIVFCVLCVAFPIIGGIRGLNGQTWKYPLSIPFLK